MTKQQRRFLSADCPLCGASGQRVDWWKSLSRRARTRCTQRSQRLESELRFREYIGVILLSQVMVFTTGVICLFALLAGYWSVAAALGLVTLAPPFWLGMFFHARRLEPARPDY